MFGEGIDPAVADVVKAAVKKLEELGAVVELCSFPHAGYAPQAYGIIAPAEASSNLARFDGIRYGYRAEVEAGTEDDLLALYMKTRGEGFGPEVKRRVMLGTHLLSSDCYDDYYLKAAQVRTVICEDYQRLFEDFDLLVSPTTPKLPFKLGKAWVTPDMYFPICALYSSPGRTASDPLPAVCRGFACRCERSHLPQRGEPGTMPMP